MTLHIGSSTLSQISDNGNQVLQSSNLIGCDRLCSVGSRSLGSVTSGNEVQYNIIFNGNLDTNEGIDGARYTAPHDGLYWVYCWFMAIPTSGGWTNAQILLRVNNSSSQAAYCMSSTNGSYRDFQTAMLVDINAGDYISVFTGPTLYASSSVYNRFCVVYLG